MLTSSARRFVFLLSVLVLILSGCTKKADSFAPVEVQVNDWLSSQYPSGTLVTDAQQAREWYQMAQDMEPDGEKTPEGYSYGLVFRDADGGEMTLMISSNGVGCWSDLQPEQLVPVWYAGGEALYRAAEAAVRAANG